MSISGMSSDPMNWLQAMPLIAPQLHIQSIFKVVALEHQKFGFLGTIIKNEAHPPIFATIHFSAPMNTALYCLELLVKKDI
mmetsp:Transcript_70192/g.124937  ORF Transcript_70192/g.124937 Transcript_70192/m.124937 type:complete len:81 (+) Transcript_70192:36-278(+)